MPDTTHSRFARRSFRCRIADGGIHQSACEIPSPLTSADTNNQADRLGVTFGFRVGRLHSPDRRAAPRSPKQIPHFRSTRSNNFCLCNQFMHGKRRFNRSGTPPKACTSAPYTQLNRAIGKCDPEFGVRPYPAVPDSPQKPDFQLTNARNAKRPNGQFQPPTANYRWHRRILSLGAGTPFLASKTRSWLSGFQTGLQFSTSGPILSTFRSIHDRHR